MAQNCRLAIGSNNGVKTLGETLHTWWDAASTQRHCEHMGSSGPLDTFGPAALLNLKKRKIHMSNCAT